MEPDDGVWLIAGVQTNVFWMWLHASSQ